LFTSGYENLWEKTKAAWTYVLKHHANDASWFVKADDDTFMILENLRHLVAEHSHTDNHFFGRSVFSKGVDYNSGGAGYVFSRETMFEFIAVLNRCEPKTLAEDINVATCLKKVGIKPAETRGADGKETFHPFAPDFHLIPGAIDKDNWLYKQSKWEINSGSACCSQYSIAFHYTSPKRMYLFNFYLYVLKKSSPQSKT